MLHFAVHFPSIVSLASLFGSGEYSDVAWVCSLLTFSLLGVFLQLRLLSHFHICFFQRIRGGHGDLMLSCLHRISLAAIKGSGCGEEMGELVALREGRWRGSVKRRKMLEDAVCLGRLQRAKKEQIIPSMEKYYRRHKEKQSAMIAGKQENNTSSAFLLPLPPSLLLFFFPFFLISPSFLLHIL